MDTREIFAGLSPAWKQRMREVEGDDYFTSSHAPSPPTISEIRGRTLDADASTSSTSAASSTPSSTSSLAVSLSDQTSSSLSPASAFPFGSFTNSKDPPPGSVDQLLYDDESDLDDEAWINARYYRHQMPGHSHTSFPSSQTRPTAPLRYQTQPATTDNSTSEAGTASHTTQAEQSQSGHQTQQKQQQQAATGEKSEEWERKNDPLTKRRHTDAVLSCPCCFTTLCFDCQQHALYPNQFRAMFVTESCRVIREKELHFDQRGKPIDPNQKTRRGARATDGEVFHQVQCSVCETEVGVFERDSELYHFFNVLPGT